MILLLECGFAPSARLCVFWDVLVFCGFFCQIYIFGTMSVVASVLLCCCDSVALCVAYASY